MYWYELTDIMLLVTGLKNPGGGLKYQATHFFKLIYTVEPQNKGQFGSRAFVLFLEVVLSLKT